ncbi:hypothetical protein ABPG75_007370 [Micractinium tetrahymenae]
MAVPHLCNHRNVLHEVEEGVTAVEVEPKFGIDQRAFLLHTEAGMVMWDCLGLLHPEAVDTIKQRFGGIAAIAISHPHFYCAMADWAEAFDCQAQFPRRLQVWVHEADREFITRPSDRIQLWSGDEKQLLPGCTLVRLGGHFPGSCVLHWERAPADGKPVLFTGDTIMPCMDRKWVSFWMLGFTGSWKWANLPDNVSFMYSFPNYVPLPAGEVRRMAAAVGRWRFDRLYGAFPGSRESAPGWASNSAKLGCATLDANQVEWTAHSRALLWVAGPSCVCSRRWCTNMLPCSW